MPTAQFRHQAMMQRFKPWTPLDLPGLTRWYEWDDPATLFQDSGGTTPVTTATDPIGYARNKAPAGPVAITQATAGNRPTWQTNLITPSCRWDGTDDYLFDTTPGLYAAGTSWVFFSAKVNPGGVSRYIFNEGNNVDSDVVYGIQAQLSVASTMAVFIRNDAGAFLSNSGPLLTGALDNTIRVLGITERTAAGTEILPYNNGIIGTAVTYTRADPLTTNRFAIGGLLRSTFSLPMAMDMFRFVAGTGRLFEENRIRLVRYLGRPVGLTL